MKTFGSVTGRWFSGFSIGLLTLDEKEADDVEEFISPAFLASSAANVERTDVIIYREELEAASLSATSAAIDAADFLIICAAGFVLESDDTVDGFASLSKYFSSFVPSSACACAT